MAFMLQDVIKEPEESRSLEPLKKLKKENLAKLAISLSGWLGRYTNVEYLQSIYLKRRGQLLFQV